MLFTWCFFWRFCTAVKEEPRSWLEARGSFSATHKSSSSISRRSCWRRSASSRFSWRMCTGSCKELYLEGKWGNACYKWKRINTVSETITLTFELQLGKNKATSWWHFYLYTVIIKFEWQIIPLCDCFNPFSDLFAHEMFGNSKWLSHFLCLIHFTLVRSNVILQLLMLLQQTLDWGQVSAMVFWLQLRLHIIHPGLKVIQSAVEKECLEEEQPRNL